MENKYFVSVNKFGTFWYSDKAMVILHRENGPAIENADGSKLWYQNGKRHRLDGPAIEHANGYKEYYIEGKNLTEQEFLARTQTPTCEGRIVTIDGVQYKLVKI